jgi:Putative prokaryotic signal transducing protein
MQKWFLIHRTKSIAEASILQGMLEQNEIPTQILNKQDSSYLAFGEIELYVPAHLKDLATTLLAQALMN